MTLNNDTDSYMNNMGYSEDKGYYCIVIFSILSIIMNMIFIVKHLLKMLKNKKEKISSFEQILFILSISDCSIALLWFISAIKFRRINNLLEEGNPKEVCTDCYILGLIKLFVYVFDWVLSGFALYHLKNMILNPIQFILKSSKKIRFYVLISFIISFAILIISISSKIIGVSPIITCFLKLGTDVSQKILVIIFTLFPLYNLFFFFIEFVIIILNPSYKTDSENRTIFKNHCLPTFINHLLTLLIPTLYIISLFNEELNESITWYFFFVTLIISFTPLLIGVIRLLQIGFLNICCSKSSNELEPLLKQDNEIELNIEKFETVAVKKFVMNIYISVCYCLEKAYSKQNNDCTINESVCNETNEYTISKSEIDKDLSIKKLPKDNLVKTREDFNISCVEYAPKIFSYLRKLDMIKEEDIINSLLPMNNKNGIQDSEGRGGSFFLNSDDNEFSLKTITSDEAELIRNFLLCKMAEYLSSNKDSIIGRIYGVYKISMKNGLLKDDEIYFILMKNVIGSFGENLICKYDLKGSSLNREVKIGEFVTNVMKDNNFRNIEKVLLLNNENAQKLLNVATEDANFFCKVKVMDYSLLVAKISLNNDEIEDLFGKFHRRQSEFEYFKMAKIERESPNNNDIKIEANENEDENEKLIDKYHDKNNEGNKNIRYKRDKIKPLKKYFFPSLKGDVLYIIAIIDFFQLYNLQKNLETKMKLLKKGVRKEDISSMPPEGYKDRFVEFMKDITNSEKYIKYINDPENKNDFNI